MIFGVILGTEMGYGETCIPVLSIASDWLYSMICESKTLFEGEDEATGLTGVRHLADAPNASMPFQIRAKC